MYWFFRPCDRSGLAFSRSCGKIDAEAGCAENGCRRKEEEYVRQDGERVRIKVLSSKVQEPVS